MPRQFATRQAKSLKHPPGYLRVDPGAEDELRALARSYMARPINLLLCRSNDEIADGNRRLDGILLEFGPEAQVPVCVTDEEITPSIAVEIMLESSEHTKSLTPYEKAVGNARWMELNAGKTAKDLAEKRHRDPASISRSLSLFKCVEAVVAAAREGKITESDWVAMSKATPDEQLLMLTARLSGSITSREELERHGRKRRNGDGKAAVRTPRIRIPLEIDSDDVSAHGMAVVSGVSGGEISLEDAEAILKEALKAVRDAIKQCLDARTFQAVMRDRAKAGS